MSVGKDGAQVRLSGEDGGVGRIDLHALQKQLEQLESSSIAAASAALAVEELSWAPMFFPNGRREKPKWFRITSFMIGLLR